MVDARRSCSAAGWRGRAPRGVRGSFGRRRVPEVETAPGGVCGTRARLEPGSTERGEQASQAPPPATPSPEPMFSQIFFW